LPSLLRPQRSVGEPRPPFGHAVLLGWVGMRGVDSLAAALAIPLVAVDGTTPFPHRNLILLVAFSVILTTLVLQGLTLPLLIRRLGLPAEESMRREEIQIRLSAAEGAIQRIEELARAIEVPPEVVENLRALYQLRIRHYRAGLDPAVDDPSGTAIDAAYRLMLELLKAERQVVIALWAEGLVSDAARQRIELAMDYEELRLNV
jgi:NhaP-type Na+/H+ or K+/H+ antiporter